MAVSERTATTATSGASASASIVINKPTSTAVGDIMIVQISVDTGSSITITLLAGWTLLTRNNNTTVLGQGIYYRVADGTEGSSFTWALTSCQWSATLNSYPGADPFNPFAGVTSLGKTAASTAATFTANKYQCENAYGVLLTSSRNTTAAVTVSVASSGYTVNGDTSTSATAFIQAANQGAHAVYTFPYANQAPGSSTFSGSVTDMDTFLFLRPLVDGHSLNIDSFSWNTGSAQTLACPAFSTGYGTEGIIVFATSANTSTPTISGGGLTFTLKKAQTGTGTNCYEWSAKTTAPLSAVQITVDSGVGSTTHGIFVQTFVSVDTAAVIGNTASATALTTTPSSAVTTSRPGSWVYGLLGQATASSFSAGASQGALLDVNNGSQGFTVWRHSVTPAAGTSVTNNGTVTSNFCAWIVSEIIVPPINTQRGISDLQNNGSTNSIQAPSRASLY